MQRLILDRPRLPRNREVRACLPCRTGKIKCDRSKPRCQRCLAHNKTCVYVSRGDKATTQLPTPEIKEKSRQPLDSDVRSAAVGRQGDQTIWPDQVGLLAASEDAQVRYYSSSSWLSALDDSDGSQTRSSPVALSGVDSFESPETSSSNNADIQKGAESPAKSLLGFAHLGEVHKLVCYFAEFNHFFYPVVDIPEIIASLRNLRNDTSAPAGSSALLAAMCYRAASSLAFSSEAVSSNVQPETWKDLSHQFLFASGYPLRPNMNTLRAALLLAASSMAEWTTHPDPTPISVLVRAAQALGLHRDPESFQCSVREADFRRRLWWSIHAVDQGYSLAHAVPPLIHSTGYDVKKINAEESLEVRMLGTILHTNQLFARLSESIYGIHKPTKDTFRKLDEDVASLMVRLVAKSQNPKHGPLEVFIAACERMCCYKVIYLLHQPYLRSRLWPQDSRGKALEGCKCYIRDFSATLKDPSLAPHRWMLTHWNIFHACAIVLQDLCQYPNSTESAELLELMENTFAEWSEDCDPNWRKLEGLRLKAWNANRRPSAEQVVMDSENLGASLSDWDPLFASLIWDDPSPPISDPAPA